MKATLLFPSLLSRGQLFKERICSSKSDFFPFRVDLSRPRAVTSNDAKQKFMQLKKNITLGKVTGAFIRAGAFIRINTVIQIVSVWS